MDVESAMTAAFWLKWSAFSGILSLVSNDDHTG